MDERRPFPGKAISGAGASGGLLVILLIAFAVLVVLAFLLSETPIRTLGWFFLGPVRNSYYLGNMLNSAIPLIFGGLGVSIALQAGCFNLGGEGQLYFGALIAALCAPPLLPLGVAGAFLALAAGAAAGGLAAAFSGFLKIRWNTPELITTFLLSHALSLITNYLITGPFLDPGANLQSTPKIPEGFRFPLILPPSNLSAGALGGILAVILAGLFLYRTRAGYEVRITGLNPVFARYGGIDTQSRILLAMFLSGLLYGLGGGVAIFGTYHAAIKEFSSGLGWNGLAVALIARNRPRGVIPAAILFAWIGAGARLAMQFSDVTVEIASLVQSVIFFLITSTVLQ
ncbi:MAG: ABC transporter permease, partial [Spirochaetales bacterium]|nr:ABC transporter permease [Spirochaetales bacterium]